MSLRAPDLDTRTFKDLVDEARARIPRYTPEWTNLNDSDPGMTLVKLHAWLTETLLYQLNRLPELNYLKFLELLNVRARPATAATTQLTFTLKPLSQPTDPLVVLIPKNAQVSVDDPDLATEVVFETDYGLKAINAAIAAVLVKPDTDGGPNLQLITQYVEKEATAKVLHAFYPFGATPAIGDYCLIGILLRPHRQDKKDYSQDVFPDGPLDLTVNATEVFEKDNLGETIPGPLAEQSRFPWEVQQQAASLEWEVYAGINHQVDFGDTSGNQSRWKRLSLADETAGLRDSGHVRLEIPQDISAVGFWQLPRSFWWEQLALKKPPTTVDELIDDLQDVDLHLKLDTLDENAWKAIGVPDDELGQLMSCCNSAADAVDYLNGLKSRVALKDSALPSPAEWLELDVGYDRPAMPPLKLVWLRVRVTSEQQAPVLLNQFLLNTVPATAAVTRLEEQLGASDGRPTQQFQLNRVPVYHDPRGDGPELELEVVESGQSHRWQRVNDFFRQEPASEVYLLDETRGSITLGDGVHGRIPVAGALIVARRYRYGGGAVGNAGPGTVTRLKSVLPRVASVTNVRGASGGRNAEPLEDTKLRASHELRARERAVSAEDFAVLARQTPGVAIQRAYALARQRVDQQQALVEADGAVTVVILPFNDQETPQPSEAQLRAVCRHLDPRRLITTELFVTGPRYKAIRLLRAELRIAAAADLKGTSDAAVANLLRYFHPLRGGENGAGWPFGGDIYFGNVYERLLAIQGVRRAVGLEIELEETSRDEADSPDFLSIPDGHLVHLPSAVIDLKVVYDNDR